MPLGFTIRLMYRNDMFSCIYNHFETKISPQLGEHMFALPPPSMRQQQTNCRLDRGWPVWSLKVWDSCSADLSTTFSFLQLSPFYFLLPLSFIATHNSIKPSTKDLLALPLTAMCGINSCYSVINRFLLHLCSFF